MFLMTSCGGARNDSPWPQERVQKSPAEWIRRGSGGLESPGTNYPMILNNLIICQSLHSDQCSDARLNVSAYIRRNVIAVLLLRVIDHTDDLELRLVID